MKIATVTYRTKTLMQGLLSQGYAREVKPGNLDNAIANFKAKGVEAHTIKLYRDGDIKDGWHHLTAMVMSTDENLEIKVEIHD